MRALVIGGTGQTGSGVAEGLRARGVEVRVASRRPDGSQQVRFDWGDPSTHDAALADVDAVYLVAPAFVFDPAPQMVPLIDRAIARGVRSFALLSSSVIEPGPTGHGAVHAALQERAPGWTVLQPSWFMQNFVEPRHALAQSIAREGVMVTATGTGRVGFIDAADIAAVAVESLLAPANAGLVLTGPAALSYDEAAEILSEAAGRRISHRAVSPAELRARLTAGGMPAEYAAFLAGLEERIAAGAEDRTTEEVLRRTGRPPRSLQAFARAAYGEGAGEGPHRPRS